MNLIKGFAAYWKGAFDYKGVSSKKEFIMVICCNVAVAAVLGVVGGLLHAATGNPLMLRIPNLYSIAAIVPTLAMAKRILNGVSKKS